MSKQGPAFKRNLRADSAWVLLQILEHGRSSRDCLPLAQERHQPQDRAWIHEMTMGVLRHLPQLQLWLRQLLNKPLKGKYKIVELLIQLGFYQVAFSRVAEHAAVAETVNAAKILGADSLSGLVNGVLRQFIRDGMSQQISPDPRISSGLPKWLFTAITSAYPQEAIRIFQEMNRPAPLWLRVNRCQLTPEAFQRALEAQNIGYITSDEHPDGLLLVDRVEVTSLPGYAQGWFSVQDGAAQLAARYLSPREGERVLDCCAAPGGKTAHLLEFQSGIQFLLALDVDQQRTQRIEENMRRLGHSPSIVCADALQLEQWWDGQLFDRILLDAPCSATGVIRRHPDIRWLRKSNDVTSLVSLQSQLLETLWTTLKPGGTLLYATCSILPVENKQQIKQFLQSHEDARLAPLSAEETVDNPGRQIFPGEGNMDGFYLARIVKC